MEEEKNENQNSNVKVETKKSNAGLIIFLMIIVLAIGVCGGYFLSKNLNNEKTVSVNNDKEQNKDEIECSISIEDVIVSEESPNTYINVNGKINLSYNEDKYIGVSLSGYCIGLDNEKYLIWGPGNGATVFRIADKKLTCTESVPQNIVYPDGTSKKWEDVEWENVKIKYCKINKLTAILKDGSSVEEELNVEKSFNIEDNNKNITKEEALKIATEKYKDIYDKIVENSFWFTDGKKTKLPNVEGEFYKVNLTNLKNYFSDNMIERFKGEFIKSNGEYYAYGEGSQPGEYKQELSMAIAQSSSIFGHTDQDIRNLTIIDYTDNTIVATGLQKSIEGDSDKYPYHIVFVKENNKWLIDFCELPWKNMGY